MIDKRFISFVFEYCRQNTMNYVSELLKGKKNKKWSAEVENTIIYTAPTILLQMLFYNLL